MASIRPQPQTGICGFDSPGEGGRGRNIVCFSSVGGDLFFTVE